MTANKDQTRRLTMLRRMGILLAAVVLASVGIAAAAEFTVIQRNRQFSIRELTIKVGDRVTFVNNDTVTHNLYSETKGSEFEIELQPPGRADSVRFSHLGVLEVKCAIHPNMKLRVDVKQ